MDLSWMMWTWQSGLFILFIFAAIAFITVVGVRRPAGERKGFLPIATTGGDRLFVGLISALIVLLLWLAFLGNTLLLVGALIAAAWFAVVAIWG